MDINYNKKIVNYHERFKNLIISMEHQNFIPFFEGDKEEGYEFLEDNFKSFDRYFEHVKYEVRSSPIWYARYEGQELIDKIQHEDKKRRAYHNSACASLKIFNRLCKAYEVEEICQIEENLEPDEERRLVADFIGQYMNQLYSIGQNPDYQNQKESLYQKGIEKGHDKTKTYTQEIMEKDVEVEIEENQDGFEMEF